MNLKDYLNKQEILDNEIMERFYKDGKEITTKELLNDKLVALFTEVGEFANELSSFKYWKNSHELKPEKVLGEYVDILFFMLSIANLLEFTNTDIEIAYMEKWYKNIERQKQGY